MAAGLDMRTCWTATKDSYLGRVPKALIMEAVREGAGARAAGQIADSKKEVMAVDAEQLLAGTTWLPSILRVSEASYPVDSGDTDSLTIPEMPVAAGLDAACCVDGCQPADGTRGRDTEPLGRAAARHAP